MRIRRIRVENFRGVAEREVELAASGVTIVQGPNEVGKSSLADAVDVLFDELHTTTKSSVRDLQPIGRDVGTTVEVDTDLGPYRLTYRKTFNRDREAVLHVHAPSTGTWTGREAHERMEQLLAEHLDVELWRALRTAQGDAVSQADLQKTTSLVEALDRAAGTTSTTGVEESLYAAVVAECERYFTATGRDGTVLREVDSAVEAAAAEVERRTASFALVEQDVARYEQLERRVVELRHALVGARQLAADRETQWQEVRAVSETIVARRVARDHAEERVEALRDRTAARDRLTAERSGCEAALDGLHTDLAEASAPLAAARSALAQVESDAEAAVRGVERVEAELRTLARRLERAHDRRELADLRGRLDGVRAARQRRVAAEGELATATVDEAALARIRAADHAVQVAEAAVAAAATTVRIEAAADVEVAVEGAVQPADPSVPGGHLVTGRTVLRIGELATVTLDVGGTVGGLEDRRTAARRELTEALAEVGQDSVGSAVAAAAERVAAEQRLEVARRTAAEAGDPQDLEARIAALEARIARSGADGDAPGPEEPDSLDVAALRATRDRAEQERRAQLAGRDAADEALREARATLAARQEAHDRLAHRVEAAEDALRGATARLEADRSELDDDALLAALTRASADLATADDDLAAALGRLGGEDPDGVRALAQNAAAAAERAAAELQEAEGELREVGARIDVTGEEGRFERLEEARVELEHAERERIRTRRRASAARLLHDRMTAARDRARRAYLRPLQDRIESLGRIAFGADLEVELDDGSLAIDRVIRGGEALPFAALSVGAQEQLAVVQRLACAMLVCRDGASGVPLVLDDALGFSDPDRLEAMGAVLRLAGEHCQVLVLTCVPERYRHVGGADVVMLLPAGAGTDVAVAPPAV